MENGQVTSRDGTRIGFQRQGRGPGLVLVQGAMGTAYNFNDLARALSAHFTVYTPDRRGRGMSPKNYSSEHTIARDVQDLEALLAEAGTGYVFGLSSGAVITLEAARTLPRITRAAVYEPPFYPRGISHDGIRRLNTDIENGRLAAALAGSLRTSGTAPALLQGLPKFAARLLAGAVLAIDGRKPGPAPKLRDMLPGIRYDFNVVGGMDGKMATFRSVDKPMLLLSGTRSPAFLRQSIRELAGVLPQATHIEFDGLDHGGSWNNGRPEVVAAALRKFFVEGEQRVGQQGGEAQVGRA
ncbi:alpha/beta hydrolase [Actinoplanes sp. Pm04-4]|uniref:Alpha/beta hydrolase n=1 Tax=Paractinoplanes pyxinae TaxID=2997416 RepID=A0ABT4B4Z4_9ACTN|nr:alpha/beta hydrolase [Actinoplanes pyxinae]MCY1140950.1 alpha/beta hydrolase [Actinoplanes pyxinae]